MLFTKKLHEGISGGSMFKMADETRFIQLTPSKDLEAEKENIHPDKTMKTVKKLDSLSPFVKHGGKGFKILSDNEIATGTHPQLAKVKSTQKRRSLATLQHSSDGKGKLAGNGRESLSIKEAFKRKKDIKHSTSSTKVDVVANKSDTDSSSNESCDLPKSEKLTEPEELLVNEALELMKQTENVDDSYWKSIAEERRDALEETLKENETLYDEVDKLSDENKKLKKLLSDTECYKLLYTNLLASQQNTEVSND